MPLISKYASPLAVLSALAACVAAPYLVPDNPDSMIFRSGIFAALLLAASFLPLRQAFRNARLRALLCGGFFGFLLGLALSLGAELRFYGGLLPGMGSMIRRLAVPLLITPLLGGFCMRLIQLRPARHRTLSLPLWGYMLILLLLWLPVWLAYFPGMFNYDFHTEYRQFTAGEWDARHPLLYLVLTYAVYGLGQALNAPQLAVTIVTILRMLSLAAALAYSCVFVQRRASAWCPAAMTAVYGLLPIFPVMAISSAKDTPFAAALLVLSLLAWELIENPAAFFSRRDKKVAFVVLLVLTWHMRKNGIAAMLMLPLLVAAARTRRRQAASLCIAGVVTSLLLGAGMDALLRPVDQPSFQTYSLPAQQLVRAYHKGDMTEDEKEELRSWYIDSDWGLQLLPHLADAAKGSLDPQKLEENGGAFMDLWARVGKKNVRVYAEAFLMLNIGSWYPDDQTHANIYRPYGLDKGYLQTDEYDLSEYGISARSLFPGLKRVYERICRQNEYLDYPIIAQLFCAAMPLWVLLLACCMLTANGHTHLLAALSGMLFLWVSYLLGPCTLARYMLPLFCLAPAALFAAAYAHVPRKKE